jgi:hypothetical protein
VDVVELARTHTPAAINALAAALNNPRERVAAATVLLDRAWGKAPQVVVGDEERPLSIHFTWATADPTAAVIDGEAGTTEPVSGALVLEWADQSDVAGS